MTFHDDSWNFIWNYSIKLHAESATLEKEKHQNILFCWNKGFFEVMDVHRGKITIHKNPKK